MLNRDVKQSPLVLFRAILCCFILSADSAAVVAGEAPDPRRDMISVLPAMGPHPSLGDEARVFGQFVGTWDVDYAQFGQDGKTTHFHGQMIAGWILDGHAVQDLFISDPPGPGKHRGMGTTIRYFDAKSGKWRVTYIEPPTGTVVKLIGGQEGDRIVLYAKDHEGATLRWSFNDIKDNSFTWRGERSLDGGKTWRLEEEHHMTRRASATDPRLDMIATLQAMGPDPSLGDQADVFGRFVGTWDAKYTLFEKGKAIRSSGEVILGWVMDGHALQDLFITDPAGPGEERQMGTTIRFFDAKLGKWHIVYIEPHSDTVADLTGGEDGDRIVLHAKEDGTEYRWSFNDIRPASFVWRGETSGDGGKTWRLVEEHHMSRRASAH